MTRCAGGSRRDRQAPARRFRETDGVGVVAVPAIGKRSNAVLQTSMPPIGSVSAAASLMSRRRTIVQDPARRSARVVGHDRLSGHPPQVHYRWTLTRSSGSCCSRSSRRSPRDRATSCWRRVGANIGVQHGLPTLCGVTIGMGLMIVLVALGLGSLLIQCPIALSALKWGGIGLLLWLSWKIATAAQAKLSSPVWLASGRRRRCNG